MRKPDAWNIKLRYTICEKRWSLATLRCMYWHYIRLYECETCQRCGHPVSAHPETNWWEADNELWLEVMGVSYGVLCKSCFTLACRAKGILIYWKATVSHAS